VSASRGVTISGECDYCGERHDAELLKLTAGDDGQEQREREEAVA